MLIHLNIEESGQGPNLVLIHGWAMSSSVWQLGLAELEKSYRVIRVELPGHGASEYVGQWELDDVLCSLVAQLPDKCCVLGWSLGGMVALSYAGAYPQRVGKLIMLSSSPKFTQSESWECAQTNSAFDVFSNGLINKPAVTIKRFIKLQVQGLDEPKEISSFLNGVMKTAGSGSNEGLKSGLSVLRTDDLRELLKNIHCRVLMILGAKDQLVPVEVGECCLSINENIELCVLENATHVPFLSHQTDVLQALEKFMVTEGCLT